MLLAGFGAGAAVWLVWVYPWGATITELRGAGAIGSVAITLALTRRKFGKRLPGAVGVAMVLGFGVLWTLEASSTDETGLFLAGLLLFSIPSVIAGAAADLTVATLVGPTDA